MGVSSKLEIVSEGAGIAKGARSGLSVAVVASPVAKPTREAPDAPVFALLKISLKLYSQRENRRSMSSLISSLKMNVCLEGVLVVLESEACSESARACSACTI